MLLIQDLFDLSHTDHSELFNESEFVWDVLPLLPEYCEYATEQDRIEVEVGEATFVDSSNVSIGEGTVVEPGAVIQGPAVIGKNCHIRTNAYIRGNVIIGDNCVVGNSTELKNCLLFNNVAVPHFNYVGDSILGYKVHLGSSVVLSNVKTPPSKIKIRTLEKVFDTGLTKFGAAIGDNTEIGSNTVLNPGCIIGKNCTIYPLAMIRGVINSDTIVKVRQQQQFVTKRDVNVD